VLVSSGVEVGTFIFLGIKCSTMMETVILFFFVLCVAGFMVCGSDGGGKKVNRG